ncbi:hypothetical protein OAG1_33660 [Agarivorans sp. OAG1]|nr:hypothetical protein OAG1_33660 [Agarivorans sp. OAG1]
MQGSNGSQVHIYAINVAEENGGLLLLIPPSATDDTKSEVLALNKDVKGAALSHCTGKNLPDIDDVSGDTLPAYAVPLAATAIQQIYVGILKKKQKKIKTLKAASTSTYSARLISDQQKLNKTSCVLVTREVHITDAKVNSKSEQVQLAILLKVNHYETSAFSLTPIAVNALNSTAMTRIGEDYGNMNLGIAMTLKSLSENTVTSAYSYIVTGSGSVSVPKVNIDGSETQCINDNCGTTGLIAKPPGEQVAIELTFAVTEAGNIGYNFDANIAELEAHKAAWGPVIKEAATTYLTDDD